MLQKSASSICQKKEHCHFTKVLISWEKPREQNRLGELEVGVLTRVWKAKKKTREKKRGERRRECENKEM